MKRANDGEIRANELRACDACSGQLGYTFFLGRALDAIVDGAGARQAIGEEMMFAGRGLPGLQRVMGTNPRVAVVPCADQAVEALLLMSAAPVWVAPEVSP